MLVTGWRVVGALMAVMVPTMTPMVMVVGMAVAFVMRVKLGILHSFLEAALSSFFGKAC